MNKKVVLRLNDETYNTSQNYIENTSILVTKFENEENSFELIDFMPRYQREWVFLFTRNNKI